MEAMSTIRVICEECGGAGKVWEPGDPHVPELAAANCSTCEGLGSRRATHADVEAELKCRHDVHLRNSPLPPPKPAVPARATHADVEAAVRATVFGVLLGILIWAFIIWTALTLAGCAPGRQFARTGWIQNGTRDREIVSAGYSVVGRYFQVGEGVKASAYTGTYYDAQGDVPYALLGGRLSCDAGVGGVYSLTLDGCVPEDWEDAEYYLSASVEWPWP